MKLAIVGAYGAGKTTLITAYSNAGLPNPLPSAHGSAMRNPAGSSPKALEETTDAELVQLVVRRYAERAVAESGHRRSGFLSDGSLLHEWAYASVRLAVGLHPSEENGLDISLSRETNPCAEVIAQIGCEAMRRSRDAYDAFVHLPIEFPLNDSVKPVSEHFRFLFDRLLLDGIHRAGIKVHTISGTLENRLDSLIRLVGQGV